MDRSAPDELVEESADMSAFNTFGWINDIAGKYKRTKPILTPRFIPSCTDDLMDQLREIQRAYNLPCNHRCHRCFKNVFKICG